MDVLLKITLSRFLEELLTIHNCEDTHYAHLLAKRKEYESIIDEDSHSMSTSIRQLLEIIEEIRIIENEVIYMRGFQDGGKAAMTIVK